MNTTVDVPMDSSSEVPSPEAWSTSLYALVTELKLSRAPVTASQLRGSCVQQIKEVFAALDANTRPFALARLVQLLLDHTPNSPDFELVLVNLVEDLCVQFQLSRADKGVAVRVASAHKSPLSASLGFSLVNPLLETITPRTR